ncbi:MAG: efflux RND transporter permease subunit, partial [Candidatus Acidiferrales bacterium]
MARFFIDRPVFAIVISLFLVLAGTLTLLGLPIAQFPEIALPAVQVRATYLGANADVVEEAVTAPLDQQINGATDMLYIRSVSGNDGTASINVTFALERDPDLASVEVQNRVSQASPLLPPEVLNVGVTVTKQSPDTLMFIAFYSPGGSYDALWSNNYANIYVVDTLKRVTGIGDVRVFGSEFGMRLWLRPDRMADLGITTADVAASIREQNVQAPAGQIGQPPAPSGQNFQYSVRVKGRLVETSEFENIIVRSRPDGSFVRIKDIARVELGARTYDFATTFKGQPATMMALYLAPGANAVQTAGIVREELERLQASFPPDLSYTIVVDTTEFVYASMEAVVQTFLEALLLVSLVVFVFLQNWRATLIPMLAVPVSLIATFISYAALGFSVNTLSLFGMILAIGIVVDDAIVVVEAVEHHIARGLAPKDATRQAMDEVSAPVIAIALVLAAVFVPMAFIPGVTGQLYKQFALTVAVSVLFSALVALTLTPALCALMLKPRREGTRRGPLGRFFAAFNRWFERATERYSRGVRWAIRYSLIMAAFLVIVIAGCAALFRIVPSGFVPEEDQGYFFLQATLAEAASQERTQAVVAEITRAVLEQPGVESNVAVVGFDILSATSASNAAFMVVRLKPWNERTTQDLRLESIMGAIYARVSRLPEAVVVPFNPPPLPGFGATGGFSFMLQAPPGVSPQELVAAAQQLIAAAQQRPEFGRIYTSFSAATPGYRLEVDREKVKKLGVPVNDVFSTLQAFLGGVQINDFTRFGRNFKVTMQADPAFRQDISEIHQLFVRSTNDAMVPLDTLMTPSNISAARYLMRYNLYRSAEIGGAPAPGYSTGQVITAMEELVRTVLPPDYRYEWSGQS